MSNFDDRRSERRLTYHWFVCFAEESDEEHYQGEMDDLSSKGAAFTCHVDEHCPYCGEKLTINFSVPYAIDKEHFDMESFTRTGTVCRVDEINNLVRRVAMQFATPLPFKPGEKIENFPHVPIKVQ